MRSTIVKLTCEQKEAISKSLGLDMDEVVIRMKPGPDGKNIPFDRLKSVFGTSLNAIDLVLT